MVAARGRRPTTIKARVFSNSLMNFSLYSVLGLGALLASSCVAAPLDFAIRPAIQTEAVPDDADDPAIWVNPTDAAKSVIVGTNKHAAPSGGLYVFGFDGKLKQRIAGLDRPNNVDIQSGFPLKNRFVDIAVTTERNKRCLRVFAIENGVLRDLAPQGLPVFVGEAGESGAPMGVALYKRPRDGAVFAVVSRKTGPAQGYLWQYRLTFEDQTLRAEKVRELGQFSGKGEIEAVAVDDEMGAIYYSDEGAGYRKWAADPDDARAKDELGIFGVESASDRFGGDREGIAVAPGETSRGVLVVSEQIKVDAGSGGTVFRIYRRGGSNENSDDQSELLARVRGGADDTDGLEVTTQSLGPAFPRGALVAMNSNGRNFWIYDWRDIERGLNPAAK